MGLMAIRTYEQYKKEMDGKEPSARRISEFALSCPDAYRICRERYSREADLKLREHNRNVDSF